MIDTVAIRKRILELAFSGKLVKQDLDDENAELLVKRIAKRLNNSEQISIITPDEYSFEKLPEGWCWCRLSDIGTTNIGLTYHPEDVADSGVIVLRSNNIKDNKMSYSDVLKVNCEIRDNQYIDKGDILVCARNGSKALVGKCAIYDGKFGKISFGAFMAIFRTELSKYVYYYFTSQLFRRYFSSDDTKQINQVTQNILKNSVIPIPPLDEQKRITQELDDAFQMLDRLDELQAQYSTNLEVLKSKIIDAGIQGKLTEQLPEDGTAEDLLKQIAEEKKLLVKEKKIKATKVLPQIREDETPFKVPNNWKWVRVADVFSVINGDRGKNYPAKNTLKKEGEIPFISALNIDGRTVVEDNNLRYLSEEQYEKLSSGKMEKNDVIVCIRGSLGKHGLNYFEKGAIASSLIICRACYRKDIMSRFLMYYLKSGLFVREIKRYNSGVAQPNLAANNFEKFLVPLPPVDEQVRIVEKLDEILALI